ncbi:hypothetical protein MFRU_024g00180 [Monilinia fructicola]|uniref:BRCT domain-containing protein n=1 Tax=Monilinia fructicola TaxID=38448 RepID=A0A5M9J7F0_MONFR|nr:hypothetical protein EYC84_011814 [Monilinia fructicola]KAG4028047.1 hypothetical protein MFRU_024g00180 [Monilinia fructicola]
MSPSLRFPTIYVFGFLFSDHERKELEDELEAVGALRYTIQEAEIGLTKIPTKARVKFELRKMKVMMIDVTNDEENTEKVKEVIVEGKEEVGKKRKAQPGKKVRKITLNEDGNEIIELSSSGGETEDLEEKREESLGVARKKLKSADGTSSPAPIGSRHALNPLEFQEDLKGSTAPKVLDSFEFSNTFKVLKLNWYFDSIRTGSLLPIENYLIYEGRRTTELPKYLPPDLLTRAAAESEAYVKYNHHDRHQKSSNPLTRPTLLTQTTSEHDDPEHFPPLPEYLKSIYSCERPTPLTSPNDDFIIKLKSIKLKRLLDADHIGVRAYSSSIASIAAYPYPLTSPKEVTRLPNCDQKLANLFLEYQNTGSMSEADEFQTNPRMQILRLFYNIWGVGETTAREFHDNKGWRDLDDIIEYGWDKLSRVQQIGVKYYDEFLLPVPRAEVEAIGSIVRAEARKIDPGYQTVIVGGYRRGKMESGDVDIMLTHPDEKRTWNVISELTGRLEDLGCITHILRESRANSERGQRALDIRHGPGDEKERKATGFDSLDKSLVVWQDINDPTSSPQPPSHPRSQSQSQSVKRAKNPNPHRRVDIIITPWKTAGVAIIGWSGGTTFQRDLRRYLKDKKGWRFDSSGVRDMKTGDWIDLEGDVKGDWDGVLREKEMAVFEKCGLEWREPWERCTG